MSSIPRSPKVRRQIWGVWLAARGILYPPRKPHPQSSGEWLFVVLTCEALLLKKSPCPGSYLQGSSLVCDSDKVCFLVFGHVWSEGHWEEDIWHLSCVFSRLVIYYFISMLSCVPYSHHVDCDQFKTLRSCFVKKKGPFLSPFVHSLYFFINWSLCFVLSWIPECTLKVLGKFPKWFRFKLLLIQSNPEKVVQQYNNMF